MKGQPRTNAEKAYLVLQHLYELATDKDPTDRNPYRMEQEIIHHFEHLAEEFANEAAGMADDDDGDLVEYIKTLREKTDEDGILRDNIDYFADLAQVRQKTLANLRYEILKVYREIFDCSNGDPEGTDEETLQDILTEYKRVLKLKDTAEEALTTVKESLAREREWTRKMGQKLIEIQDICER